MKISLLSTGELFACSNITTIYSKSHVKISTEKYEEIKTDSKKWLTPYREFPVNYVSFMEKYKKN